MESNLHEVKQMDKSKTVNLLQYINMKAQQKENINNNEDLSYDLICELCKCHLPSPDHILPHIKGRQHTNLLTKMNKLPQHIPVNSEITINVMESNLHEVKQMDKSKTVNLLQYINMKAQQKENINNDEDLSYDLICELCKCHLPSPDHILPHIKGRQHTNLLTKINKLPQNIKQHGNDNKKLDLIEKKDVSQTVNMDIFSKLSKTKDYQAELKSNIDCKICTTSSCMNNCLKKYDEIFLSNKITTEGSKFICTLCERKIDSLYNMLQHINGKFHTNKLKCQDKSSNICETEYTMRKNSDKDENGNQKPTINYSNDKMNVSVNEKYDLNNTTYNTVYSMKPLLNNTSKVQHLIKNEEQIETNDIQDNSNNTNAFNKCLYFCELCSTQIDIKNLHEHINTIFHKCNTPSVSKGEDIFLFKCFCCKSIIQGTISLTNHFNSTKHLNALTNTVKRIKTNNTEIFAQSSTHTQNMLEDTKYTLCSVLIPKIGNRPMHLSEKCLISFDTSNIVVCDNIRNKIIYSCSICRVLLNTAHNLTEHCQARMHAWRIGQFSREISTTVSKDHSSSEMGKEPIMTPTDHCFDITSDINAQITKVLHVSPFKSKSSKKRNYKEQQRVTHLNKMYCEKYLEIEEQMYTVDKKKLNNIELNFKAFVPYNEKNFYCLACNVTVSKELNLLYEHARRSTHEIEVNTIKKEKGCNVTVSKELNLLYEHARRSTHEIEVNTIKKEEGCEKLLEQSMWKISKNFIMCYVCNTYIENNTNRIDVHINNRFHKKRHESHCTVIDNIFNSITQNLNNLWYSVQKFACVLCAINFNYKVEFIEHIVTNHLQKMELNEWKNGIFDFCIPCATLWLGEKDCYTEHCNDVLHKYLIKSKDFMVEDLPECIKKLLEQVDKTCDILFQETQILMNDTIQKEVAQSLENALKSFYPSIKAFLFGSRITGLGSANSDIDIYLDCGNTYHEEQEESLSKKYLMSVEQILCKQKEWEVKDVLKESRTPIIKLLYRPTVVQCDISITNGLSVENSKLIRSFNDAYPPCRKLILFVKKWLSCFNLPSRHGLTNYAIAWLVIFYLQEKSHLPSVATLIKKNNKSKLICGWETGVAQPQNNNTSVQPLPILLLGFFQFYANFNYRHYVICPLMGYILAKRDFINLDVLPSEMKPYINRIKGSNNPEYFRIDSPLCVQDPFDLSHNLTKAVSSITLKYFKQYCQDSASILNSTTK